MSEGEGQDQPKKQPMKLTDLEGVGDNMAKRLRDAGIGSVEMLAVTPVREVMAKTGVKEETALRLVRVARELAGSGFVSALDLYQKRKNLMRCTTGSKALDRLLAGGVETQAMTELVGEYGVGKTQICLTLSVNAQLPPEKGGLGGGVIFFDTEGTFSAQRVYEIAKAMGLDPEPILNRILVSRVYTSDHQTFLLDHAFKICQEEGVKLVVVDSLISHFRGEYVGRENLSERQQKLNSYLHKLLRLAEAFNLAVVVTNQAQANPAPFFGSPDQPAGGHVMAHACTHRVKLRKSKGPKRIAQIFDSPYIPFGECVFQISERGIEDAEEEKGRAKEAEEDQGLEE